MKIKIYLFVFIILYLLVLLPCESCFQNINVDILEERNHDKVLWNNIIYTFQEFYQRINSFIRIPFLEKIYETVTKNNEQTIENEAYEGYTIYGPEYSRYTYLLNMDGEIIHTWKSDYIQGFGGYLLENGEMLRLDLPFDNPVFIGGGVAGRVEKFDEESNLLWEFQYSTSSYCAHHDIEPLPNGNVLIIAWEYKTRDETISAGRNPNKLKGNSLWPDHIIEVEPNGSSGGDIVWEWHLWDHLIHMKQNYFNISSSIVI